MRQTKYKDIYVYEDGRVYSTSLKSKKHKNKPHFLSHWNDQNGRLCVQFTIDNKIHKVLLHRLLYETYIGEIPKGMTIDHIDRNFLNNKLDNLRLASITENNRNTSIRKDNTTGYKGVYFNKKKNIYQVFIGTKNNRIYLGSYKDALSASKVYDEAALKYFKEFAATNNQLTKKERV